VFWTGELLLRRKAQISQVFTYLVIILVVGVILIMGYKGIAWIMNTRCEQQRISFEKSLLGFIDEYSDKGSVHEEVLRAPCNVREVCFVDSVYYDGSKYLSPDNDKIKNDSVVVSHVRDKTDNVFVRTEFTEPIGFSSKLSLSQSDQPFTCFKPKNGDFKFLFTGLGRKTMVESGWSD